MPEPRSPLSENYSVGRNVTGDTEPGVSLCEITGWNLIQAACWRNRSEALSTAVETALGVTPPTAPSWCSSGNGVEILGVAPGRLWCIAPTGDPRLEQLAGRIDNDTGCTTDLGHSHIRVRIEGRASRALLNAEIAIDLDTGHFPTGRIARTSLHHVPVTLQCMDSEHGVFDLYLPHTFAASIWSYLLDLASVHGYDIAPPCRIGSPAGSTADDHSRRGVGPPTD